MEAPECLTLHHRNKPNFRANEEISLSSQRTQRVLKRPLPSTSQPVFESLGQSQTSRVKSDEYAQLEAQKRNLLIKLDNLREELTIENRTCSKLEEDLHKARTSPTTSLTSGIDDVRTRIHGIEMKIDKTFAKYNDNLSIISQVRSQLDQLRKDRFFFQNELKDMNSYECNGLESQRDGYFKLTQEEKNDVCQYDIMRHNISSLSQENLQVQSPNLDLIAEAKSCGKDIQSLLDLLHLDNLSTLFEQIEKYEHQNCIFYNHILEHEEIRKQLDLDIQQLEEAYKELEEQANPEEENANEAIKSIESDINSIRNQIKDVVNNKNKDEEEYSRVYEDIEYLFNALDCSWDDAPDEKTTVTTANAMFVLTSIEAAVSELMHDNNIKTTILKAIREEEEKNGENG